MLLLHVVARDDRDAQLRQAEPHRQRRHHARRGRRVGGAEIAEDRDAVRVAVGQHRLQQPLQHRLVAERRVAPPLQLRQRHGALAERLEEHRRGQAAPHQAAHHRDRRVHPVAGEAGAVADQEDVAAAHAPALPRPAAESVRRTASRHPAWRRAASSRAIAGSNRRSSRQCAASPSAPGGGSSPACNPASHAAPSAVVSGDHRPVHRRAQQVGQELHGPVARHHAAVDAQHRVAQRRPVGAHRLQQVEGLERHAFQRRPRQLRPPRLAREAEDGAARLRVPPRRAEAGEARHQVHRLPRIGPRRQLSRFRRRADDAEPVAQPLHRRAGHEDRALQRVAALAAELPGDRGEQPVARRNRLRRPC